MEFIVVDSYDELSRRAADIICQMVKAKPKCVLGLATGSTPLGTYQKLIEYYRNGMVDFSSATSVNLDEYVGLSGDNPQSYRYFMNENLFSKINISPEHTFVPDGCYENQTEVCEAYDKIIESLGGIDIQLLGIGLDGHIGFNEPDQVFIKETHIVELDETTIEANARFFKSADEVPRSAITMGMGAIMSAKKILLIANGKRKEEIVNRACFGPVTPLIPASILQLHPNVVVLYTKE